jgi:hypothetical protein
MELCRIQWGSRNLSRIIYGEQSSFGLKEINYSLPIAFEYTDNPELYLSFEEVKELLAVNYQGYQNGQQSLMNFSNIEYVLANVDDSKLIANRFQVTEAKAIQLCAWLKSIEISLSNIEQNYEMPYFRGKSTLSSQLLERRLNQVCSAAKRIHSHQRDCSSLETARV